MRKSTTRLCTTCVQPRDTVRTKPWTRTQLVHTPRKINSSLRINPKLFPDLHQTYKKLTHKQKTKTNQLQKVIPTIHTAYRSNNYSLNNIKLLILGART